jgi:hypothetical protein
MRNLLLIGIFLQHPVQRKKKEAPKKFGCLQPQLAIATPTLIGQVRRYSPMVGSSHQPEDK